MIKEVIKQKNSSSIIAEMRVVPDKSLLQVHLRGE